MTEPKTESKRARGKVEGEPHSLLIAGYKTKQNKTKPLLGRTGSYEQLHRKGGEEARKKAEGCPQGKREADRKEIESFSDQES